MCCWYNWKQYDYDKGIIGSGIFYLLNQLLDINFVTPINQETVTITKQII